MSDLDETWYVGRGRWVMDDNKFFPRFNVKVKVMKGPTPDRQDQRKRIEVSIILPRA